VLMLDGDNFFGFVHVPAFVLAGYALSGPTGAASALSVRAPRAMHPANLMA
jgi:hypothetical protein